MNNFKGLYIIMLALLSSCMVTFTSPPGSPRTLFPKEMQGTFIAIDKSNKIKDTIWFIISETKTESNDKFLNKLVQFSDTTTFSHLGDYYFFNVKNSDSGSTAWWTFPVKVTSDALYVHSLYQGKEEKKLSKYLKPTGNKSEYVMDNEPFKNYCEKKLRKRKAIKFKRIK